MRFNSGPTHALLDGGYNNDTSPAAVAAGDMMIGNTTPLWARLPIGAGGAGGVLGISTSLLPQWQALSASTQPGAMTTLRNISNVTNTANSAVSIGFAFPIASANPTNYLFDVWIQVKNASSSTCNFQVHPFTSATLRWIGGFADTTALGTVQSGYASATGTNIFGTNISATGPSTVVLHGWVTNTGGVADTLDIDFLDVAGLGTVTVQSQSSLAVVWHI